MAEDNTHAAPALDTNIESGNFDEKRAQQQQAPPASVSTTKKVAGEDDDEDEDIDALIEDLESQDGHAADDEEEEERSPGGGRVIPEELLQTDSRVGLTESEVTTRRRKYGLNQMKEEKENLILKFFGYFVGPIQFVMEVSLINAAQAATSTSLLSHFSSNSCIQFMLPCGNCHFLHSTHVFHFTHCNCISNNLSEAFVLHSLLHFSRVFFFFVERRLQAPHELQWVPSIGSLHRAWSRWRIGRSIRPVPAGPTLSARLLICCLCNFSACADRPHFAHTLLVQTR